MSGYWRRLAISLIAAVLGSAGGSLFTWATDAWPNANPAIDGLRVALFSLGPALAIVAAAPLSRQATIWLSLLGSTAMLLMWRTFAANDSSTSGLVFLLGWWVGVPAAITTVWWTRDTR